MNDPQTNLIRCPWPGNNPLYVHYHDTEWGVPEWDDRALFAKLILDGFQAGLSWITVLRKRENFLTAFDGLDPARIARYGPKQIERLVKIPGIIRHRGKIEAAISNARAYLDILDQEDSFATFLWQFVDGRPVQNEWRTLDHVPTETKDSQTMSKALRGRGFKFCGPTITYAFMQAVGMVNDHLTECYRHHECRALSGSRRGRT